MATTGKIPLMGFLAAARKFVALFGFSPPSYTPRVVSLDGSYVAVTEINGSVLAAVLDGSYVAITSIEGSVS